MRSLSHLAFLIILTLLHPATAEHPPPWNGSTTLVPYVVDPLPLGSVRPQGWLADQLALMADGLPGHEHDFYRYVRDSVWVGGADEYSDAHEALPYWLNGLVPLAALTDSPRLWNQARNVSDAVLDRQQSDGWLGSEPADGPRDLWGRFPLVLALTQLAEADPDRAPRIRDALHRFVACTHTMLADNYRGYISSGDDDPRGFMDWLTTHDPRNGTETHRLFDCMYWLQRGFHDWTQWYTNGVYLDTLSADQVNQNGPFEHGVNIAQGWKYAAFVRRFSHNDGLADSARRAVRWTLESHGTPSGSIIADERLSGRSPTRGTEFCTVVEALFPLAYLHRALRTPGLADATECVAFNALPVMALPDWWAHQYVAQTNQPISHVLDNSPFSNIGTDGQIYGLEPHYPYCTVNHPQGYPEYVAGSWGRTGDGVAVDIVCDTAYPFSPELTYTVQADGPADILVRISEWSAPRDTRVTVDERSAESAQPDPATGLHTIPVDAGKTRVEVRLAPTVRVEQRANDTVSLFHGTLLYANPVGFNDTTTLDPSYPEGTAPEQVRNHALQPTGQWAYAVDPSTARYEGLDKDGGSLPDLLWTTGAPTAIIVTVCRIDWPMQDGFASNPPLGESRRCVEVRLVPYGSAKLHMAELPVMEQSS
ncbi:uncharacterized protein BDW47DRAFT_134944 [Aspergillus candidus]|uniref:Six-hairpin glycosidase-like protein n=1 Tax=Aspergillus candidus TaxID=41067 RepID=A0A2I2EZC6_ASPCN|nr:hypothetical protein BDW47DRAFT_134944 [Aspergillus candidus]PLB33719.1 hypothetical protein BDW47DRAFT_134944 [Aspergillus candidus]